MGFKAVTALLFAIASVLPAPGLEWRTRHQTLKAAPLQKAAETIFEFTNTLDRPVRITGIDSSCDCLEATANAREIAPGATGRIHAKFTLGDRFGVYGRTIVVSTDEGGPPVALTVELDVPEAASLTPRSLEWKLGAKPTEQSVDIVVAEGISLTLARVKATSDRFTPRLETIRQGRHFRLHVTPVDTQIAASTAFRLYGQTASGDELVLSAYGNVR